MTTFYDMCEYAYYHKCSIAECCEMLSDVGIPHTINKVMDAYYEICSQDSGKEKDNPYYGR